MKTKRKTRQEPAASERVDEGVKPTREPESYSLISCRREPAELLQRGKAMQWHLYTFFLLGTKRTVEKYVRFFLILFYKVDLAAKFIEMFV